MLQCDFCALELTDGEARIFPAIDFTMPIRPGLEAGSSGAWAACPTCAALVDTRDWEGLEDRCITAFEARNPGIPGTMIRPQMRRVLGLFKEHRIDM